MADVPQVAVSAVDRLLGDRDRDVELLGVLNGVLSALDVLHGTIMCHVEVASFTPELVNSR